ncbi:hypothetical protein [Rhodococcus sp. UNC363MFTsu5.1]|nr:hypothetical protein [Rhodococcus sp. UNC363MFTsu5.1]
MTTVIAVAPALIVAATQARRHRTDTRPAAVIDTYLACVSGSAATSGRPC